MKNINYRKIYKSYFGSIPKGYIIHHYDHNRENNEINNLVALPEILHLKYHSTYKYLKLIFEKLASGNCLIGYDYWDLIDTFKKFRKYFELIRDKMASNNEIFIINQNYELINQAV